MVVRITKNSRQLAFTGLFAALIFLATFAIRIPVGGSGGYVHLGDTMVYLAASILPQPWAMAASAIGAGLSDALVPGGMIWLPATVLIKPLCCLAFTRDKGKLLCGRNLAALLIGGVITIVGYAAATAVITGSIAVAVAEIPAGLIQPVGSGICYAALAAALDKSRLIKDTTI